MAEKVTIGNCELWHGDCLNIISQISGVDVVLTDPPYGTKTDQRGESFMVGEFSNVLPIALPLLHAAMKTDGAFYCFTSWAQMSEWLLRFQQYFKLQNILVWDKKRHSGCYSPSSWQFTWEGVFFGIKGKRKIRKYLRDVLVSEETGKRIAMQKPIDVLVQMIEASCDEGDLVFDPFMGSGSSGVAAAKSGRRFVGIEINREIFELACRRIEQAYAQPRLFEDSKVGAGDTAVQGDMLLPANAEITGGDSRPVD